MLNSIGPVTAAAAQVGTGSAGNTLTTTRAIPAGRLLIAGAVSVVATANTVSAVSDSAGNVWNALNLCSFASVSSALYWCFVTKPIASGGTISFTWATGAGGTGLVCCEYAGASSDGTNGIKANNNQAASAATTVTCTTGVAGDVGRAVIWLAISGTTINAAQTASGGGGGSWFNEQQSAIGTVGHLAFQETDLPASPASGLNATTSWTGSANAAMCTAVIFAGPEQMHDSHAAGFYKRKSGLILPRPAVYRARR